MAGNIHINIKPNGISQYDEIDLLYMFLASIEGICKKLDLDGDIAATDYEELCYNLCTTKVTNHAGSAKGVPTGERDEKTISLQGMTHAAWIDLMYQIYYALHTMCTKIDADTLSGYITAVYTGILKQVITNQKGVSLGSGTAYYFNPGGKGSQGEVCNLYYNIMSAIKTITTALNGDVTANDYLSLWYTEIFTLMVENSAGKRLGVSR